MHTEYEKRDNIEMRKAIIVCKHGYNEKSEIGYNEKTVIMNRFFIPINSLQYASVVFNI
jgi:hypothetical protein